MAYLYVLLTFAGQPVFLFLKLTNQQSGRIAANECYVFTAARLLHSIRYAANPVSRIRAVWACLRPINFRYDIVVVQAK